MFFEKDQKILFIGDSITDAMRRGTTIPYGRGYVNTVRSILLARYPELGLQVVNRGVSGDTVRDLRARWDRDVLAEEPDWLSVMIGINDVWRTFSTNPDEAVALPEYEATLRELFNQARGIGARFILMTPYMIETDRRDPMRRRMDWYGEVVRQLATEYDAILVDTQAAFDHVLQYTAPNDWAGDKIHPADPGHAVIALAWLRAVGFTL
jgi:lysophospholipase L1-like esterase